MDLLLTALALVTLGVGLFLYRGFAGDDTFIHLTYARNVMNGHGFSFNPGENSYGSSAPLWTLLIAGAAGLLDIDPYPAARLLSALSAFASVLAFRSLAAVVIGVGPLAAIATLVYAVDPWLWKWGGSGMETSLAVLIALVAARMHLRRRAQDGMPASAFILGIGTLVRPELVALFLVALWDRLVVTRRPRGEAAFALFGYLVPILPWVLFALTTFGHVLPSSVLAKAGHMERAEVLQRTFAILAVSYLPVLIALASGLVVASRRDARETRARLAPLVVLWGFALGLPVAYVVTASYVASRYLLLATPFLVVLGFFAMSLAIRARGARVAAALGVLAASAAASAIVQVTLVYPRTRFANGVDERLIDVCEWVRNSTPERALVAAHEVGAIGYFSRRRILDTAGLVTPGALEYVRSGRVRELIERNRPDYYVSSGDARVDRQVLEPFAGALTLLFERSVQRGGSSPRFAAPLSVGVYRFEHPEP